MTDTPKLKEGSALSDAVQQRLQDSDKEFHSHIQFLFSNATAYARFVDDHAGNRFHSAMKLLKDTSDEDREALYKTEKSLFVKKRGRSSETCFLSFLSHRNREGCWARI